MERADVVVVGGGLAGLTLALQLRRKLPALSVLVLERRRHPVPEAAHKVGESSVEIGAHYFEHILGLQPHLAARQLRKFGFRFFFSDRVADLAAVTELGASRGLGVTSWQIDRGIFENYLAAEALARGIDFVDGATVRSIALADVSDARHAVTWQRGDAPAQTTAARWVVDAGGRAGLLKRQLGLARPNDHAIHAVWFRIGARLTVDDWSADPAWRGRCETPTRWLSTNHLVGTGYWVWLIPLASGSHSVGIVADPRFHPIERMDTFERALQWLGEHQPKLADEVAARRHTLQDFAFFKRVSYDCAQVFSPRRWALTGEAGRFLDPFYSPGSDFIAIGNGYIADLIERDGAGEPIGARAGVYEQVFRSFYDSTLALYQDQYALFGDPEVLPLKVLWDYAFYWGVLAQLYFQQRLTDLPALQALRDEAGAAPALNRAMQAFLRTVSATSARRNPPVFLDQAALPWFVALNASLNDRLDGAGLKRRLADSMTLLRRLATQIRDHAAAAQPRLDTAAVDAAIDAAGGALRGGEGLLFGAPR